ncbi:uncharacterized protein LOC108598044 [Drosophila busckii]|uniref:uncharacterized protein LOC108598044 n=1 Tax=Drosophila busckii TaxID=30019 RepID=UPI00083ED972|nr:uncharacterized protein LOC108598044 [Drosophila busckii]
MKLLSFGLVLLVAVAVQCELEERQEELHFGFHTENGFKRSEDITYNVKVNGNKELTELPKKETPKPVEYRGGYSFISADGYEYQVRYKANKNGYQPYVTAHKVVAGKEQE